MTTTPNEAFIQASRMKLKFPSAAGDLSVEDLWDIPLTALTRGARTTLEDIGNALLIKQRGFADSSILSKPAAASAEKQRVDLSVEVIRHIVQVKEAEVAAKTAAAARKAERDRLDELIRTREGNELPLEELKKQREALGQ